MKDTYWNHNGTYQAFADHLNTLIPMEGSVTNPAKNKALEKFRKASNVYYDLYNNGLCNRASSFKGAFGFAAGHHAFQGRYGKQYGPTLHKLVEKKMDEIVLAAMLEQTAFANAKAKKAAA